MEDPEYSLGLWGEFKRSARYTFKLLRPWALGAGILLPFLLVCCPSMPPGNIGGPQSSLLQAAHALGLALQSYRDAHDGKYPDGNSSTEIFQKLLDAGLVSDPGIFYIPLAGKIAPVPGQRLRPENVSWDVTAGVDSTAPEHLPVLFSTGYRVTYAPGGTAVPVIKPYPRFGYKRTWLQWYYHFSLNIGGPGIAVYYAGNMAAFIVPQGDDFTMRNVLSPDFDSSGKSYRQLTPDGPLLSP